MILIKRAYEPPGASDGVRLLIDRVWPRGLKKETLRIYSWFKDVAPSTALRKWFGHDPAKWEEFQARYFAELDDRADAWEPILKIAQGKRVTLVYAAHDTEHNNAVALRAYLQKRRARSKTKMK